jgi:predicted HD superfamily hydrolase involved in NAD metabolism
MEMKAALNREEELKQWLRARVSDGRYRHSLGVFEVVAELARDNGVDPEPLRQAALVHDCAREYSSQELVACCEAWGLPVRDVDRRSPVLLHGRVAVVISERELGLTDPAMVSAARWHTAGHPEMSLSDKLFYLADVIEPTTPLPWVPELKALADDNVDRAVLMAIEINTDHLDRTGRVVDPDTYDLQDLLIRGFDS